MINRKDDLEELCKRLRPILGKRMDSLWLNYLLEDYNGKKEIKAVIEVLANKYLRKDISEDRVLLSPPTKVLCEGEYEIGKVFYNEKEFYKFGLRESDWIQHIAIFGRSGAGKTNAAFVIIKSLIEHKKPFLIFDWKRNYRDLINCFNEEILIFTIGRKISRFGFNPLIPPPDIPPEIWLKKLIEIIAHAYFLGEGVMHILQNAIDKVYRESGVYDNKVNRFPTLKDVLSNLMTKKTRGRKSLWVDSTLRALSSLCFGEMGKVLNCKANFGIEKLLNKNIILELDSLVSDDKVFFIEALLLWIHHYRLQEGKREEFKHAIIIEEAHHVLLKKKQELKGAETITDIILREIRELGESIVLIDQHPSLISTPALGNTFCTIVMNLKHKLDVNAVASCLLLEEDEKDYLGRLPVAFAIVKLQGRVFTPFLVKIPYFKIEKGRVKDSEIKELMQSYSSYFKEEKDEKEEPFVSQDVSKEGKSEDNEIRKITKIEELFLKDISDLPISGVVKRYQRLNVSRRAGNETKDKLIDKGFIEPVLIPTRSGRVTLLKLTNKGFGFLKSIGYEVKENKRKGGLVHEFWKWKIGKYYQEKGFRVFKEKSIGNGKTVDLVIEKENDKFAVEVETGNSDALGNIKKSLDFGFDKVYCIAIDQVVLDKIRKEIEIFGFDKDQKVKVVSCKEFD